MFRKGRTEAENGRERDGTGEENGREWDGAGGENAVMWIRIDCIRIQVHKISKFSKNLLIFESKKKLLIFKSFCTYFFKGSELKHIISCENKDFCWLNSAFPFILLVILCLWIQIRIHRPKWIRIRPDPDPHHWNNQSIKQAKIGTFHECIR